MVDPYKFSGSLSAKHSTYVDRDADRELYDALIAGEFCYVLESRQTGKSSLRNRIMDKLQAVNIKYVAYNITKGSVQQVILSDWYQDQISRIISDFKINYSLNLGIDLKNWWEDTPGSDLGKYEKFIEDVLLARTGDDKIVIFIDEIDSVLDFPFPTDDFFAFIRACYEERNNKSVYKRLTFCILGVASPNNLIKDKRRTPFNIGKAITLKPFPVDINDPESLKKIQPLIKGLEKFNDSKQIMKEILDWTGGQPFLTQKLCQLMVEESKKENSSLVEEVVRSKIIDNWEFKDEPEHLKTIRDRILMNEKRAFDLLKMYKDILLNGQIDANSSYAQIELKLTGLVLQDGSLLKAYNPIYKEIFHLNWVEVQLGKLRLFIEEFNNWNKADFRCKQLYLLYGDKFEKAWEWKQRFLQKGGDTTGSEERFLSKSEKFWKEVKKAFPYECNYEAIIQAMNDWTGGFEEFNDIIFDITSKYQEPPAMGTEKDWMGDLVTSHLSRFCQPDSIEKQFMDDNDPNIDRFRLICSYQKILQNEAVTFDESPEHKKLADMCLIIKNQEDNKLRILNKIYEYIFNQEWVNKMLDYICPYAKEFQSWQDSGCQDEFILLKGEYLQKAVDWIQNKNELSEPELEFIITSVVWEKWQSNDAVNKVKEFLPPLKEKAKTLAHLVRVIQVILEGTIPQLVLLQEVLKWVCEAKVIPIENEVKWLEGVINNRLIDNWQNSNLSEHFQSIEKRLVENSSCEPFWLLVQYRQILLKEKVKFDNGIEQKELLKLGLVVNINQYLKIANDIYKTIFHQGWAYSKLLEYQRNHAINLLIWLKGCNQDDPALKELKEWTEKNEGLTQKIVSDRQNTKLNNNLSLDDEIRLLTYDIIKMEVVENQPKSIQHSLNYIFQKDKRNMATEKLDILLNKIVDKASEIGAVVVLGLKQGMVLRSSVGSNLEESNNQALSQIIRTEAFINFVKLKTIPEILDNFGEKANFENLNYVMFTLKKGVVIAYFTKIKGNPFAICFISTSNVDMPGLFLAQCEGKFEEIEKELAEAI